MTVAPLQLYALFLAGFEYSIEYKNTTQHGSADGLSRLPLKKSCNKEVVDPVEIFRVPQIEVLPVNADMIRQATQRDPILSLAGGIDKARVAIGQGEGAGTVSQTKGRAHRTGWLPYVGFTGSNPIQVPCKAVS